MIVCLRCIVVPLPMAHAALRTALIRCMDASEDQTPPLQSERCKPTLLLDTDSAAHAQLNTFVSMVIKLKQQSYNKRTNCYISIM